MIQEILHKKVVENCSEVQNWFKDRSQGLRFPFYTSFDIRDAQYKIAPVDANIFPAGFNNICPTDKESAVEIVQDYLDDHYTKSLKKVLLLTEEHTQNLYYWDNVWTLKNLIESAGREVRVAIPRDLAAPLELKSASGHAVTVHSAKRDGSGINIEGFMPELIISNNDFSVEYEVWANGLETPVNPPRELGWYRRRKDLFFSEYNRLAGEFGEVIGLDPWHLQVETETFPHFEVDSEESREALALKAQGVIDRIQANYTQRNVESRPTLFVKNNAGTYGLGVIAVQGADDIRAWNNKSRKKMKAAKGGREISEVIIQEGIPTVTRGESGQTAEPVIYMVGCQLAGGFLRTHTEKGPTDSLNSPGAVYQRMCVSDLKVKMEGCPNENAYGWIAKLAFLSVAREAKDLGVEFKGYLSSGGC